MRWGIAVSAQRDMNVPMLLFYHSLVQQAHLLLPCLLPAVPANRGGFVVQPPPLRLQEVSSVRQEVIVIPLPNGLPVPQVPMGMEREELRQLPPVEIVLRDFSVPWELPTTQPFPVYLATIVQLCRLME